MESFTIVRLQEELLERGLDTSGTKADLYTSLQEALSQEESEVDDSEVEDVKVNPEDSVSTVLRKGSHVLLKLEDEAHRLEQRRN